jgi:hypothetical protein
MIDLGRGVAAEDQDGGYQRTVIACRSDASWRERCRRMAVGD